MIWFKLKAKEDKKKKKKKGNWSSQNTGVEQENI